MSRGHESKHWVEGVVTHDDRILWYQIDGKKYTPEEAREGTDTLSRAYVGEVRVYDEFFKDKYSDLTPENKRLFDTLHRTNE